MERQSASGKSSRQNLYCRPYFTLAIFRTPAQPESLVGTSRKSDYESKNLLMAVGERISGMGNLPVVVHSKGSGGVFGIRPSGAVPDKGHVYRRTLRLFVNCSNNCRLRSSQRPQVSRAVCELDSDDYASDLGQLRDKRGIYYF
jgi:hypothetical protein